MEIYGSRRCTVCKQKYDWAGSLENQMNTEIQNQILRNRNLHFAKFSAIQKNTYKVNVRCPYCKEVNEFEYTRTSFTPKPKNAHMILSAVAIWTIASFFSA